MTERPPHSTSIRFIDPPPSEVAVGATLSVTIAVTCAEDCDLGASALDIAVPLAAGAVLPVSVQVAKQGFRVVLQVPMQAGEYTWRISLHEDVAGARHVAEPLLVKVTTVPLTTSLAVWDIPAPVVVGTEFEIKVGAKSAGDVALRSQPIEVLDDTGAVVGRGALSATPWPGTSGLYWANLRLPAPEREGPCSWSLRFSTGDLEVPHVGSTASFSLMAARSPDHRLTLRVRERGASRPIIEADVRLGVYRAVTGPDGTAVFDVPKGGYDLFVWKIGYEILPIEIKVTTDRTVDVEATAVPEEDPDEIWQS